MFNFEKLEDYTSLYWAAEEQSKMLSGLSRSLIGNEA